MGEQARGAVRPSRALVVLSEFGPLDQLAERVHDRYVRGDYAGAVDAARRALPVALGAGDRHTSRYLRYVTAVVLHETARHDEALQQVHALLSDVDAATEPFWRAKGLALLAETSSALGEQGRAMDALAEASWLLGASWGRGYNRLSATQAVALAMRSMFLHRQADELMMGLARTQDTTTQLSLVQEAALLQAHWAAVLDLLGRHREAVVHHVASLQRALHTRRLSTALGHPVMQARADVYEALAWLRLGEPELAAMVVTPATRSGLLRPDTVEALMGSLVVGELALGRGDLALARDHFEAAGQAARRTDQDVWGVTALDALATVDETEFGNHPGVARWRWVAREALLRLWRDYEGRFSALSARIRVRELLAQNVEMGEAVRRDPLTGVGNRQRLLEVVEAARGLVAVLFVDIDHFKVVNDTYSHEIGDVVLRQVSALLQGQCRSGDVVTRYGGDEFVVIVTDDAGGAGVVAERVHAAVREHPWQQTAAGLRVTVSVGVAAGRDASATVAAADAALYEAKRSGRDRVVRSDVPPPGATMGM